MAKPGPPLIRQIPIAFYAPMKPPDHPQPSGDRTIARNLMAALAAAGFAPQLASRLRSHEKTGDQAAQEALRAEAQAEADRLVAQWRAAPAATRPQLWFTYHLYDRAPDWLGPRVAAALRIPYVVAEASLAPSRARGRWRLGHTATVAALRQANAVFVLNENDRPCILEAAELADAAMADKCVALPPFLARLPTDSAAPPGSQALADQMGTSDRPAFAQNMKTWSLIRFNLTGSGSHVPVRLLAVAMLRHGDKLASLTVLAEALALLKSQHWTLTIVGDGPARGAVAELFAGFGDRVIMAGAVHEPEALNAIYAAHDLLVWPAVNEAFGMVLLEAQANGCPVLAGDFGGVSGVVRHGQSGWLVCHEPREALARGFAEELDQLLASEATTPGLLASAGNAAAAYVRDAHCLDSAAAILRNALTPLLMATKDHPP